VPVLAAQKVRYEHLPPGLVLVAQENPFALPVEIELLAVEGTPVVVGVVVVGVVVVGVVVVGVVVVAGAGVIAVAVTDSVVAVVTEEALAAKLSSFPIKTHP